MSLFCVALCCSEVACYARVTHAAMIPCIARVAESVDASGLKPAVSLTAAYGFESRPGHHQISGTTAHPMINQHGLARTIPADVALEVRRRCGFGCVVCGASVVDYEHIEPEFKDAKWHDPGAIALLCGGCHDNVTRRRWSKGKIKRALASPYCKSSKFSWGELDVGMEPPVIYLGTNLLWRCDVCIAIGPYPVFSVRPPEEIDGPFRVSATFLDEFGRPIFRIRDNLWEARSEVWDIKHKGPVTTVRGRSREACLQIRALPGIGLVVQRMNLGVGNVQVQVRDGQLRLGSGQTWQVLTGFQMVDCPVGIQL